jgi:hypothetical protein
VIEYDDLTAVIWVIERTVSVVFIWVRVRYRSKEGHLFVNMSRP